jgi:Putative adhesin
MAKLLVGVAVDIGIDHRGFTNSSPGIGGLLLVDADLDRLVARADDGAVILSGAVRTVEVHTRDGSVHTREPISVRESFSVNSIDGDVSVDFRDVPPRRISVVTADGDINIGLPGDGPFAVQTSTDSRGGDTVVRVPQASDAPSAQAVVSVQTADRDVTIEGVDQGHR